MPSYIITYDLLSPGQKYDELHEQIKSYGTWARVTESNWIVVTDKSAVQIRDHLLSCIDSGDRLFVVKSGTEAAWHNTRCKNEWLRKHL